MKKFMTDIELIDSQIVNLVAHNSLESNYSDAHAGLIYFDTNKSMLRYYNGTTFKDLDQLIYTGTSPINVSGTAISLAASGVTAGSYGPSDNATPAAGGKFNVPYVTVDGYGRVTAASTKTITIPASIKNPNALKVQGNGKDSFTYDGSSAKTLNIKAGTYTNVTSDTSGNITIASTIGNASNSAVGLVKGSSSVSITDGVATVVNASHTHTSANISDKTTSVTDGSSAVVTSGAVYSAIESAKNEILNTSNAMVFRGSLGTDGTTTSLPTAHQVGDTYVVATAGTYAGETCEIGDLVVCQTTGTTANDSHWIVVQSNINGAVTGPASSVNNRVAVFNGTSGKVIKDSGYTIAKSVPSNAIFTDTVYTHPTFTAADEGLYKVQVNGEGHVIKTTAVAKSDITALGIPAKDTTYNAAGTALGLVKSGGDVTISSGVITVTDDSHSHSDSTITSLAATKLTGTLSADRLPTSGVTAGNYGPSANATPAAGGTFSVPYITVDNKGRVTAASTKTITLPATTAFAKKATIAVPAGNANTEITITHNLAITGVTIGSSTVYPSVVQVYETATNQQIECDVILSNANSCKLKFSSAVAANAYYAVITG